MTGLPCSGKTTIAKKLQEYIQNLAVLDGDELREWLSPKDFSKEGRNEHNKKVARLAKLLLNHHVPVCVSLISPYKENREKARTIIGKSFLEVYIKCPVEICQRRDTKGLYKKARRGEIKYFTGISDKYDVPSTPDFVIDTEKLTPDESAKQILDFLKGSKML
jgi:adenylylsulfate kinase